MSASRVGTPERKPQYGFSLVEMLVALVFMSILMAGMAVVFRTSIGTFSVTGETISAQHHNRWALDQISDDISQAGFIFPDRALPARILSGAESLFSVTPDQTLTAVRISDTNPGAVQNEIITTDAFQFFMDMPLPVQGTWTAATLGESLDATGVSTAPPTSAAVTFTVGSESDLRAGDVEVICDSGENGNWEHPLITGSPVGNPITFATDQSLLDAYTSTSMAPGIMLAHPAGVPVLFVRPAQLVRYSVRAVALDPGNTDVRTPCLVRQQASYPATASGTVNWTTVSAQILAENVSGFKVDLSFDGGASWCRPTTAPITWSTFAANANTTLGNKGLTGFQSITDSSNRAWFRNIPCLIRIDLTTRTAMRREEYSTSTGSRAWRTRTQTLMISPRNFGLGL
jgi:prepilin-type N-terminal cleavage/methylation domain-containing protein